VDGFDAGAKPRRMSFMIVGELAARPALGERRRHLPVATSKAAKHVEGPGFVCNRGGWTVSPTLASAFSDTLCSLSAWIEGFSSKQRTSRVIRARDHVEPDHIGRAWQRTPDRCLAPGFAPARVRILWLAR